MQILMPIPKGNMIPLDSIDDSIPNAAEERKFISMYPFIIDKSILYIEDGKVKGFEGKKYHSMNVPSYLTVEYIEAGFKAAEKVIRATLGDKVPDIVYYDYCIYRLDDTDILAYGIIWNKETSENNYSAKVQGTELTDLYHTFKSGSSKQVSFDETKEICHYDISDGHKRDSNGNILQHNHIVNEDNPIPVGIKKKLDSLPFPYMNKITFWAVKPYGTVITFSLRYGKSIS